MKQLLGPYRGRAGLERAVELACRHLELDVAYIAEMTDGRQIYRAVAGDAASFKISVDEGMPVDATYCNRLLGGEIPNVVQDTSAEPLLSDLPITRKARIGAYIGVPLQLADESLFGTFCCLNHEPDPTLDGRELRFMSMLGELIVDDLNEERRIQKLRADIEHVLETQSVDVAYQPIMDLRTERFVGLEALARFPTPFPKPEETLAASADVGLGLELERLLVTRAWAMFERLGPDQFLAINLTAPALLELARRANRREEVPLDQLVVEVTEHAAVESYAALRNELAPLRERGMRIAVDDAGAGYASLRHVLELRPDFIKIDRSLCGGIADDHARRVAVRGLVLLARDLGAEVIAEGIETLAELATIRELGIDAAQGYLFAKPSVDPATIGEWIDAPRAARGQRR
jgi:EAL domain-containing protein (putative c-di-GMP-specific phosphodiesterase class I)